MAKTELPHHHGEEKMNTAEIREVLECVDNFQTIADVFRQLGLSLIHISEPTRH